MARKPPTRKSDLDAVFERLQALEERIARLEGENHAAMAVASDFGIVPVAEAPEPARAAVQDASGADATPQAATERHEPQEIPEEILLVLSAAVAAFLGERAHVKQVRLLHSDAWAQQGRVSVMASHRWAVHR
jgi:methylmalonyl-CoA carboxyltransferase 12S subunit